MNILLFHVTFTIVSEISENDICWSQEKPVYVTKYLLSARRTASSNNQSDWWCLWRRRSRSTCRASVSDRRDSNRYMVLAVVADQVDPRLIGLCHGYRASLQIESRAISTVTETRRTSYQRVAEVPSCCWRSCSFAGTICVFSVSYKSDTKPKNSFTYTTFRVTLETQFEK